MSRLDDRLADTGVVLGVIRVAALPVFFAAERLALQLRTLTLADVLPGFGDEVKGDGVMRNSEGHEVTACTAQTTVHEALEMLTGAPPAAADTRALPFTLPQLMAAFGAALQREEDAWKR